jgi:hypothetical protein
MRTAKKLATPAALEELKQMGINPEVEQVGQDDLVIRLRDAEGRATEIPFNKDRFTYKNQAGMVPGSTYLPDSWQKKGIGTRAYKAVEELTGLPIFPDDDQTQAGYQFHGNKGYGKEFGIDEKTLESKLTPTEKLQRNARKKALMDALSQGADQLEGPKNLTAQWDSIQKLKESLKGQNNTNTGSLLVNAFREATESGSNPSEFIRKNIPRIASKVKSIAPVVGATGALMAGSASDALADVAVPGGVEAVGQGSDQVLNPEQQQSVEASRQLSSGEPMNQQRFQALQKMLRK